VRTLLVVTVGGVCFWLGMAFEISTRPPPVVYITKADGAETRCALIDRIKKQNRQRRL
jgi:hypothetical protein